MIDEMTDYALIKEACSGNSYAFTQLVERHYMTIYKMAYKYIGNREDAQDIAQNACIKLGKSLNSFRFDAAFTTWLYRLVINTAKDFIKQRARAQDREKPLYDDVEFTSEAPTPEAALAQRDVLQVIDNLPEKMRDVVILVCWEGLTHAEAAEILEVKENTVSWRLHEIRKLMKTENKGG